MRSLPTALISLIVLLLQMVLCHCSADGATPLQRVANNTLRLPNRIPVTGYGLVNAFPGVTFEQPVALAAPPRETNRLFVVERTGSIYVITNLSRPARSLFLDLSQQVDARNIESGLLGLAFHPGFATNGYFFVYRTMFTSTPGAPNRYHDVVSRFQVSSNDINVAQADSELVILAHVDDSDSHNGGDLKFGPDGYLYVSVGERVGRDVDLPDQTPVDRDLFGAILRIDVDLRAGNLPPNPHPASTPNYSVPADNPFVGIQQHHGLAVDPAQVRTELYATGFRNPWRIAFDPVNGDLYVGDVGDGEQEEVDLVVAGGDYGWPYHEGTLLTTFLPPPEFNPIPPLHTYDHGWSGGTNGDCVIGGVVYRGEAMPWLRGRYLFADFRSGYLWSLTRAESGVNVEQLLGATIGLTAFGTDPRDGGVLAAHLYDGTILRLVYVPPGEVTNLPPTLADTGVFKDLATLTPDAGVVPYDINVPFWSDDAQKSRWFCVPKIGSTIAFNPTNAWTFPTGAVWIKHFDLELTNGVPASVRRLETRVLVNTTEGFYGLTYRWGDARTNAWLVPAQGQDEQFVIRDTNGVILREQSWHYPSRAECMNCHTKWGGRVLGFTTAQLNRPFKYGTTETNQLQALAGAGYLVPIPAANAELPALALASDSGAPLEFRVRSYFQANCSACHVPGAHGFSAWDARIITPLSEAHIVGDVITPGSAEKSELYQHLTGFPRLMPPIGTTVQNTNGINLVANWTTNLPSAPWSYLSIGDVLHQGGSTASNGVYRIGGTGLSVEGTNDAFEFMHQPFADQPGQFIARLVSLNASNSSALAGVMIRDGTGSSDRFVLAACRKAGTAGMLRREQAGAAVSSGSFNPVALPQWLRLVRRGNDVDMFRSQDGTNWVSLGTTSNWVSSTSFEVGFAVNSRSRTAFNNAVFDSVSQLSVMLTSQVPASVQQPADILLEAAVTHSGRAVARVEFYDGAAKIGEAVAEPYVLTASNVWAGAHQYSARAVDAAGTAVSSQPIFLTVEPYATLARVLIEDRTHHGAWPGAFGANGYIIADYRTNLPLYANISITGATNILWRDNSRDSRALAKVGTGRGIAAAWQSANEFTFSLALRDGRLQRLSFYFLDWDTSNKRIQQVRFLEPGTSRLVASHTLSNFSGGIYLSVLVRGNVDVRLTALAGSGAVLSGVFLDDYVNEVPTVTLLNPIQGESIELPADLFLEASFSDPSNEVQRVEYYLDGNLVGSQTEAPYSARLPGLLEGTHTAVARVYDDLEDHRDSPPVTFAAVLPRARAIFVREDATTRGNWVSQYGTQGFLLPPLPDAWPAGFFHDIAGAEIYPQFADYPDFLQLPDSTDRMLPLLYSYSTITYEAGLADGHPWQLALYFFDDTVYPEVVTVLDSATGRILDVHTVTNGLGGRYLVWNAQGNVSFQVFNPAPGDVQTRVSGLFLDPFTNPPPQVTLVRPNTNLAVSTPTNILMSATASAAGGIRSVEFHTTESKLGEALQPPYDFLWEYPAAGAFQVFARAISAAGAASDSAEVNVNVSFAAPASARFVGFDTGTTGNWRGKYGAEAYWLPTSRNYIQIPPAVSISTTQTWADYGDSVLPKALHVPSGLSRILSFWLDASLSFQTRLNDGRPHRVSVYNYAPNWTNSITITLRPTGSTNVLDTREVASQDAGTYLTWELQGDVTIEVTQSGQDSVFLNAIFVDPVPDPYGDWRRTHFAVVDQINPAISGEQADPDSDGYDNWSEFLLGGDPISAESPRPLRLELDASGLRLHWLLAKTAGEESVSLQSSRDLVTWQDEPNWQPVEVRELANHIERTYQVTPDARQSRFFRLRMNAP